MLSASLTLILLLSAETVPAQTDSLDAGYRAMYNLDFEGAHRVFRGWEASHPADPMGPVSDAAAYLFGEFDRLRILQSEFFTDDSRFAERQHELTPDPRAKQEFERALAREEQVAQKAPSNENTALASLLRTGLHADYLAFIEKRNMAALSELKQSRVQAEQVITEHPKLYDAYIAVGVENYMLSLKPLAVRWLLRMGGAQTDKQTGLERLQLTAEKGHYLLPYARLLLAVAALRDHDVPKARGILTWLATEYPKNPLYREELQKLK